MTTATIVAPDGTTIPTAEPHHHVEISLDNGYTRMDFVCNAPEGAQCRLLPDCYLADGSCVEQSEDGVHAETCTEENRRLVDSGDCNLALWINGSGADENGHGTLQVPVATEWNGDCFDWTFATNTETGAGA